MIAGCLTALALAGCAGRGETTREPQRPTLSLDEVFRLHEAGVGSKVIVAKIQTTEVPADLTVARIIELKAKGLPDDVLEALVRATEVDEPPRRVIIHRYGPSFWDPWHFRHPYAY